MPQFLSTNEVNVLNENSHPLSDAEIYEARLVGETETVDTEWGEALALPGSYVFTAESTGNEFVVSAADYQNENIWQPL